VIADYRYVPLTERELWQAYRDLHTAIISESPGNDPPMLDGGVESSLPGIDYRFSTFSPGPYSERLTCSQLTSGRLKRARYALKHSLIFNGFIPNSAKL
jgi:hypothetical protein